MRSFVPTHFYIVIVALMVACSSNESEKATTNIASQPTITDTVGVRSQPAEVGTADSAAIAEAKPVEVQVEGVLPKPNSEIDAASSTRTPPANPGKAAPVPKAPTIESNPEGHPTGYISRKEVSLQSKAEDDAAKTRAFKLYEGVIILESIMTDDAGQPTKIPTWYKVECIDKKQGWVKANCVTLN
jgi:hypothetical protein